MRFGWIDFPFGGLLLEASGDGGGGGADAGGGAAGAPGNEPAAIDLSDDSLIRVKGVDKPVKYGEHVKGLQGQFTKASQRAAQLERELQAERQARAQYEQAQRAAQARAAQGGNPQADPLAQLKALPYLSGEEAANVVANISQQIRQRDMVLLGALHRLKQMQDLVKTFQQERTQNGFEAKINRWLKEGGYPDEAADLAKEIYLAYEGDDLDQEFPNIFKARWEQLQRVIEASRQAKIAANRRTFVPGKGGNTGPSKPLELKGNASAKEVADALWAGLDDGSGT